MVRVREYGTEGGDVVVVAAARRPAAAALENWKKSIRLWRNATRQRVLHVFPVPHPRFALTPHLIARARARLRRPLSAPPFFRRSLLRSLFLFAPH